MNGTPDSPRPAADGAPPPVVDTSSATESASVRPHGEAASPAAEWLGSHAMVTTLSAIGGAGLGAMIGVAAGPLGSLAGAVFGALIGIVLAAAVAGRSHGGGRTSH